MESINTQNSVLTGLSNGMADAVERVAGSLVTVYGRQRQPATGIVTGPGTILTAEHVLEREEDITIRTADGRTLDAQFGGRDPSSDVAVLKVAELNVEPATIAEQAARVGQFVLAVGRPSESGPMASIGIVSAIGGPVRTGRGGMLEQYIRTDATPYPGFSGGPLISTAGTVLGLMTTGLAGGIALAVPINIATRIAQTLGQHGRIKRGFLGISSQPVYLPEAQRAGRDQETGLLIMKVEQGSPAEKAGFLLGDLLVSLDAQTINDADSLQTLLTGDRVGTEVAAEVIRGGTLQALRVTVGERE